MGAITRADGRWSSGRRSAFGAESHGNTASGALRPHAIPEYVRRAQAGDAAGFREIYEQHKRQVAIIVVRMAAGARDPEDVVQEAFIQVFRAIQGFRGESQFSTWLHRLVVNVTLHNMRTERRRGRRADLDAILEPRASPAEAPDERLASARRLRVMHGILQRMSERRRLVFVLHDLAGMRGAELSDAIGVPINTVRTRLFYARRELYAALAACAEFDDLSAELAAVG
jgi:RNA polymerase sigma-70 factor (ECF subfamily)